MKADFGCGPDCKDGYLRLDIDSSFCPAVVADVQHLPFKNKVFEFGICDNVVEHCIHPLQALSEVQRVCEKSSVIVPKWYHYTAWYQGNIGVGGRHWCIYFRGLFVKIPLWLVWMHLYWFIGHHVYLLLEDHISRMFFEQKVMTDVRT